MFSYKIMLKKGVKGALILLVTYGIAYLGKQAYMQMTVQEGLLRLIAMIPDTVLNASLFSILLMGVNFLKKKVGIKFL